MRSTDGFRLGGKSNPVDYLSAAGKKGLRTDPKVAPIPLPLGWAWDLWVLIFALVGLPNWPWLSNPDPEVLRFNPRNSLQTPQ